MGLRDLVRELRETTAIGDCYRYAYQRVTTVGGTLVQGTVTHPWDKNKILHAWVEDTGRVFDDQTEVMQREPLDVTTFTKMWKPVKVQRFTADEARAQVLKTRHYGPWR